MLISNLQEIIWNQDNRPTSSHWSKKHKRIDKRIIKIIIRRTTDSAQQTEHNSFHIDGMRIHNKLKLKDDGAQDSLLSNTILLFLINSNTSNAIHALSANISNSMPTEKLM